MMVNNKILRVRRRDGALINFDFGKIWDIIYQREKEVKTQVISGAITLLIGPPRAGKSTYCKNHFDYDGTTDRIPPTIISRDDMVMKYGVGETYSEKWKSRNKCINAFGFWRKKCL